MKDNLKAIAFIALMAAAYVCGNVRDGVRWLVRKVVR